jgi:hypothetical protein
MHSQWVFEQLNHIQEHLEGIKGNGCVVSHGESYRRCAFFSAPKVTAYLLRQEKKEDPFKIISISMSIDGYIQNAVWKVSTAE